MYTLFLNLTTNLKSYPNNFLIQTMKISPKVTNGKRGSQFPQFSKTRWINLTNNNNIQFGKYNEVDWWICMWILVFFFFFFYHRNDERLFWLSWRILRNASRSCKRRWPKRRLSSPPAAVPAQPCYLHPFLPLSESNKTKHKNPIKLGAKFCKFNTLKEKKKNNEDPIRVLGMEE